MEANSRMQAAQYLEKRATAPYEEQQAELQQRKNRAVKWANNNPSAVTNASMAYFPAASAKALIGSKIGSSIGGALAPEGSEDYGQFIGGTLGGLGGAGAFRGLRSGVSRLAYEDGALNPKLASIGDALEHPTTIPGKLVKAGASALFPPPAVEPPTWESPQHTNIYGSPDFPGPMSKLSTRLPAAMRGDPFAPPMVEATPVPPELGSPENPGPFSKLPNRLPPQYHGDPFTPPSGETVPEWESPSHMDVFGSPDFPGPMSKLSPRLPKNLRSDPFSPTIPEVSATPVQPELGSPENPGLFSKLPTRLPPNLRGDPFQPRVSPLDPTAAPEQGTTRSNVSSDPQDLISRMKKIAVPGEEPSAADLKRAGDFTQVSTEKLKTLARFGDKLAQNELNRRLSQ